jgi:outer membrane protein
MKIKNISLILNAVLLAAVIVLYVFAFPWKKTSKDSSGPADASAIPVAEKGIVYLNIDSVLYKYDMYTDISNELQGKLQVSEDQLGAKEKALRKEMEDYQYKIDRGLMTRAEAAQVQQELAQKEQAFYQLQNNLQMQLTEEQQVAQRKVIVAIMDFLKSLEESQKYNYQYILGTTFGGNVLYANENLNISEMVIRGLNEEYQKAKKEKEE